MEDTFENFWNKAEELAGDRLEYVQRSRLQWRYIKLMLHPDEAEARKFVTDVKRAGVHWMEGNGTNLPENTDYAKPPHKWFTFTWWI